MSLRSKITRRSSYLYQHNTGYLGQGGRAWHGVSSLLHGFKQIHRVRQIPQAGQLDWVEGLRDHQLPPGQAGWTYHQVNTGRVHAEPDPTIHKNWAHESRPSVTDGYPWHPGLQSGTDWLASPTHCWSSCFIYVQQTPNTLTYFQFTVTVCFTLLYNNTNTHCTCINISILLLQQIKLKSHIFNT